MLNFTQQEVIKLLQRCLRAAFANILFAQFANFVSNTQILDSTSHYIISVMTLSDDKMKRVKYYKPTVTYSN